MLGNEARLDIGGSIHLEGFQGMTAGFLQASQEFPEGKSRISSIGKM